MGVQASVVTYTCHWLSFKVYQDEQPVDLGLTVSNCSSPDDISSRSTIQNTDVSVQYPSVTLGIPGTAEVFFEQDV